MILSEAFSKEAFKYTTKKKEKMHQVFNESNFFFSCQIMLKVLPQARHQL